MKEYAGISASGGIAFGKSLYYTPERFRLKSGLHSETKAELSLLNQALEETRTDIEKVVRLAEANLSRRQTSIFEAHLLMLEDPEILSSLREKILGGESAFNAVLLSFEEEIFKFGQIRSEYLRERREDLKDVRRRLLRKLDSREDSLLPHLSEDVILLCEELFPSDIAALDPGKLKGFVTRSGGHTGHIAILARTLGIPAIVGLEDLPAKSGLPLAMDGSLGTLVVCPDEETRRLYEARRQQQLQEERSFTVFARRRTRTASGKALRLSASVGDAGGLAEALKAGAEGIGLFRTEFLFMNRSTAPSEEEQYQIYRRAVSTFPKHRAVMRTLDIGADKALPYVPLPEEPNPALGCRALRLFRRHPDLILTQLRALLRASVHGNLALMFPMIASSEELSSARALVKRAQEELRQEGLPYDEQIEIGITIEVPHAAIMADVLAEEADFFSIGTNDLVQYSLAADRLSASLADLCSSRQPGILRLIAGTVRAARQKGLWVSLCGESAADWSLLPFWLGLDLDELSLPVSAVQKARSLICRIDERELSSFVEELLQAKDKTQVQTLLKRGPL